MAICTAICFDFVNGYLAHDGSIALITLIKSVKMHGILIYDSYKHILNREMKRKNSFGLYTSTIEPRSENLLLNIQIKMME